MVPKQHFVVVKLFLVDGMTFKVIMRICNIFDFSIFTTWSWNVSLVFTYLLLALDGLMVKKNIEKL